MPINIQGPRLDRLLDGASGLAFVPAVGETTRCRKLLEVAERLFDRLVGLKER